MAAAMLVLAPGLVFAGAASGPRLVIAGSSSLSPVLQAWAEDLRNPSPGIEPRWQLTGTELAASSFADGAADLAAMSRPMTEEETKTFIARRKFRPIGIRVALDAVTIIVNASNPTLGLSIGQVDSIFSSTRRCGGAASITAWGQVTPSGIWGSRPIQAIGLNRMSGTRSYLRERGLCGGEFKGDMTELGDAGDVVRAVQDSANAVGFVPMAFVRPGVRALPLSSVGRGFVAPVAGNITRGLYPLSRFLYLYVAKAPGPLLATPAERFVTYALSADGQMRVAERGFVPLPISVRSQESSKLR